MRRRHGPEAGPPLAWRLLEELGCVNKKGVRCILVFCPSHLSVTAACASSVHSLLFLPLLPFHLLHVVWIRHDDDSYSRFPFCTKKKNEKFLDQGNEIEIPLYQRTAELGFFFLCRYHYCYSKTFLFFSAPSFFRICQSLKKKKKLMLNKEVRGTLHFTSLAPTLTLALIGHGISGAKNRPPSLRNTPST
jgi:hypothetical protein